MPYYGWGTPTTPGTKVVEEVANSKLLRALRASTMSDFLDHVVPTAPGLPAQPLIDIRKALDDAKATNPYGFGFDQGRFYVALEAQARVIAEKAWREGRAFGVKYPDVSADAGWQGSRAARP